MTQKSCNIYKFWPNNSVKPKSSNPGSSDADCASTPLVPTPCVSDCASAWCCAATASAGLRPSPTPPACDSGGPFLEAGLRTVGSRLLPGPGAGATLPRPLGAAPQPASGGHRPAPTASRLATLMRVDTAHALRAAGGTGTSRSKPPLLVCTAFSLNLFRSISISLLNSDIK